MPIALIYSGPHSAKLRGIFFSMVAYIALISLLGHKELRFIFNSIPFFNLLAAFGLSRMLVSINKSILSFSLTHFFFKKNL